MNTTPKEQDGEEGVAAAHGSRPSLDQTVLGVAPPAGVSSEAVSPAAVSPAAQPPAAMELTPLGASVATPAGSALVAAPTIAVSGGTEAVPTDPSDEPALDGRVPELRAGAEAIAVGSTLPLQALAANAALQLPPVRQVEPPPVVRLEAGQQQRTELSSDYLLAARDAALSQLAASATPPAPVLTPPAPRDTPRGADEQSLGREPPSRTMDFASGSGARFSMAPAYDDAPSAVSSERPPTAGSAIAKGFEPVPVLRAPLAESLSGALGPLAELGGSRNLLAPSTTRPLAPAPPARETSSRWLLLCSVALATVGVVTLGERLLSRYRVSRARELAVPVAAMPTSSPREAPSTVDAPASSTLLANRPAPERGAIQLPVRVISSTGGGAQRANPASVTRGASQESQLAATAGRHVLSGSYAEALPVYQQLQRTYPENTAYSAMARLLAEKLASSHDTRTVTPAGPARGADAK